MGLVGRAGGRRAAERGEPARRRARTPGRRRRLRLGGLSGVAGRPAVVGVFGVRRVPGVRDRVRRAGRRPRRSHDPLGRLFPGLSRGARVTLDWVLTIAGAILIVLAVKHWVVNPYRIPSSSMEPYLNCAKAERQGCLGDSSDRVLACRICLAFSNPSRGDVVVFNTPPPRRDRVQRGRDLRQARHRPARRNRAGGPQGLHLDPRPDSSKMGQAQGAVHLGPSATTRSTRHHGNQHWKFPRGTTS